MPKLVIKPKLFSAEDALAAVQAAGANGCGWRQAAKHAGIPGSVAMPAFAEMWRKYRSKLRHEWSPLNGPIIQEGRYYALGM